MDERRQQLLTEKIAASSKPEHVYPFNKESIKLVLLRQVLKDLILSQRHNHL